MASSRLGLGARELFSIRTTGLPRIGQSAVQAYAFTTSQRRLAKPIFSRDALEHANGRLQATPAPKLEMSKKMQRNISELTAEAVSIVLPGTFVLPTLSQYPKPFMQKLKLFGQWLLIKGQETLTNSAIKFSSKPTIFKRALYRPKRSVLIPTAKALHRSMAEALASGDKNTLSRICSRQLASSLLASIDARPRGRRYGWELVRYTGQLLYPSVKSHRMSPLGRGKGAPIVRQAVVAISSRQRRVQYDAQGQVVPGSEREMDVVENVTIGCVVDARTWAQGEWRLIGTIQHTTLDAWEEEKALLKRMMESS